MFGLNLVVGIAIIFIAYNDLISSRKDLLSKNIASLAFSLSEQIKPALEFDDKKTIEEIIDGTLTYPGAEFVGIWKTDLFEKDHYEFYFSKGNEDSINYIKEIKPEFAKKNFIQWKPNRVDFGRIIFSDKTPIGFLYLSENLDGFLIFQKETAQLLVTLLLIYLVSTILISLWIEKTLTKPLIELVKVSEKISLENNLLVRAKKLSNDEFGRLTTVFNTMLDSIRETNNELIASNKDMEQRVETRTRELTLSNQRIIEEMEAKDLANEALNQTRQQLSQSEKLANVGQVSSSIAHELRNPMAAIRNSTYYLNLKVKDKNLKKHLSIIDKEISRSDEVIRRLLEITKGEDLKKEYSDIRVLAKEAMGYADIHKNTKLTVKFIPKPFRIKIDKLLFRQVLNNLFLNSIQAMPSGGNIELKITQEGNEWAKIIVTDNGHGIEDYILENIFDPLFTNKKDGIGLGLSLCKDLISRHGGNISALSKVNLGTKIIIELPLK